MRGVLVGLGRLAVAVAGAAGLVACSGGAAPVVKAPAAARAAGPYVAPPLPASAKILTPEDALLARIDQMQKSEFLRGFGSSGPQRAKVVPTAFKLGDLPVGKIGELPLVEDWKPQAKSPPGPPPKVGPAENEVVVAPYDPKEKIVPGQNRNVRLTVRELSSAEPYGPGLSQLALVEHMRRGRGTGVAKEIVEHCGDGYAYDRWIPIRWSRVGLREDGVHVAIGDAVFDRVACSVHTIQKTDNKAAQLVPGGVMYGFLGCGETCEKRAALVVAMPRAANASATSLGGDPDEQAGLFTLVTMPVEHGGGGSLVASVTGFEVSAWHRALTKVEVPAATKNIVMGVEVTQSVREREPLAIAYVESNDDRLAAEANRADVAAALKRVVVDLAKR